MLANLPIPALDLLQKPFKVMQFQSAAPGATVVFHPRFASWLAKAGLDSAPAILALRGEIVCGHPDRHVSKVVLKSGRTVFLKREHVVSWKVRLKNWLAGFGAISRSEREAMMLQQLEHAGLPGPQWLAYGQSSDGKAFLLVDQLTGAVELSQRLKESAITQADLRRIASRLGATVAELHEAGFGTPDLSAKHVFASRPADAITIIDWQSSPRLGEVAWNDRLLALARLHASLPQAMTSYRLRCEVVRSYLQLCRGNKPRFADFVRNVERTARQRFRRSTSMDQHATAEPIRLVWVEDERVVTIPELAKHWPSAMEEVDDGQLTNETTFDPIGRLIAHVRGQPWRSPAAKTARILAQLQRSNLPAPRLLAYGQTLKSLGLADSFVVTDRPSDSKSYVDVIPESPNERQMFFESCGRLLRSLHDSKIVLTSVAVPALITHHGQLLVNAPYGVLRKKKTNSWHVLRDLRIMVRQLGNTVTAKERFQFLNAYFGSTRPTLVRQIATWFCRGGAHDQ